MPPFTLGAAAKFGGAALLGGFSQLLGAQAQGKFGARLEADIRQALSSGAIDKRYQELLGIAGPAIAARTRDARITGEARGNAAAARFRRAGLTGTGEAIGQGVRAGVSLRAQNALDAIRADLFRNAVDLQQAEARNLGGLLQTPFGSVSPASAFLGGAGAGLEAASYAEYANQLAGREREGSGASGGRID